MSLTEYKKKRNFNRTPEPRAGRTHLNPIFVVQKHDASHLHFDFRLEADGVLKSWAVPKGPSMNPADKRLAVMVEDHPLDYAGFEGTIPEGNYGAGTVEIWDSGTWEPKEGFEDIETSINRGRLEFYLDGEKLQGGFALIEPKNSTYTKNGWLLIKMKDQNAVHEKYDASLISSE